jgi:hypothetical protein
MLEFLKDQKINCNALSMKLRMERGNGVQQEPSSSQNW